MTPHREGVWTGHDEASGLARPDGRRLAWEGLLMVGTAAFVAWLASGAGLALPAGAVVLGFGTFGLMGRHADDRKRAARERAKALREEFGIGPVWTVDLMVRQGELPTGGDQGLMWIENGRIVFSGLRTSFALAPVQIAAPVRHEMGLPGLRHRLNLSLARETAAGPLSLSFWPLADSLQGAEGDAASLRYALNRIAGCRDHVLEATGQWPPVALGPGAPQPQTLLLQALARVVGWSLAAAALASLALAFSPGLFLLAFVVLVGLVNAAIYRENAPRWRAYLEARRLWR